MIHQLKFTVGEIQEITNQPTQNGLSRLESTPNFEPYCQDMPKKF